MTPPYIRSGPWVGMDGMLMVDRVIWKCTPGAGTQKSQIAGPLSARSGHVPDT